MSYDTDEPSQKIGIVLLRQFAVFDRFAELLENERNLMFALRVSPPIHLTENHTILRQTSFLLLSCFDSFWSDSKECPKSHYHKGFVKYLFQNSFLDIVELTEIHLLVRVAIRRLKVTRQIVWCELNSVFFRRWNNHDDLNKRISVTTQGEVSDWDMQTRMWRSWKISAVRTKQKNQTLQTETSVGYVLKRLDIETSSRFYGRQNKTES
jgi:hypothetical protein